MKLSKLGFGSKFRREARAVHVGNMIWDKLEEEEARLKKKNEELALEKTFAHESKEQSQLIPKVPNTLTRKKKRSRGNARPGRTLKTPSNAYGVRERKSKAKEKKLVLESREGSSQYLNLWDANSKQFRAIVGREKEKSCTSPPESHQSISTTLKLDVLTNSLNRIRGKNAVSVQQVHGKMVRRKLQRKETMLSAMCDAPYEPGFGHSCLDTSMRSEDQGTEDDIEVVELFFAAQQNFKSGLYAQAILKLKQAVSASLCILQEISDAKAPKEQVGDTQFEDDHSSAGQNVQVRRIAHIYEALACVADAAKNEEESEMYRIQQVHFVKTATGKSRGLLLILAWESLGLYYATTDRNEDAIKNFSLCRSEFECISDPYIKCRVLFSLAAVHQRVGNSAEAINCLTTYINIMQKIKDYRSQAKGYHVIGNIYNKQKNYSEAIKNWRDSLAYHSKRSLERTAIYEAIAVALQKLHKFQEAASEYENIVKFQTNRVIACRYLFFQAKCHLSLLHYATNAENNGDNSTNKLKTIPQSTISHSYDSAIRLYKWFIELRSVDRTIEARKDIVTAYLKLGDVLSFFGQDYQGAIAAYNEAKNVAQRLESTKHGSVLLAQALYKLGCSLSLIGENGEALHTLTKALLSSLDSNQLGLTSNIYKHLGRLQIRFHKNRDAFKYFERCLALIDENSSNHDLMGAYFDLGMCLLQMFDDGHDDNDRSTKTLEKAIFYFKCLLQKATDFQNTKREAQALVALAECKWRLGRNDQAIKDYISSINKQIELGDTVGEMEQRCALGNLYLSMGDYTAARGEFEIQLKLAGINRDSKTMQESGKMLSRIYTEIYRKESKKKLYTQYRVSYM